MALGDFTRFDFTSHGKTRAVYRRGSGPGVVMLHVLPGLIPEVIDFGRRVVDAGFTAFLPHLFGVPGKPLSAGYLYGQAIRVCLNREFHALAAHKPSPPACRTACGSAGPESAPPYPDVRRRQRA